jgi:ribose 5-phosphate isomerase A
LRAAHKCGIFALDRCNALEDKMDPKALAAVKAVDLVRSGMVLGLGTGSTATLVVREIGRRMREGTLRDLRGVPTSEAIARVAREEEIPLSTLEETPFCDLTIDGADEVDPDWNLVKGAGGSLLREKIVAQASRVEAIVVDEAKLVQRLGTRMPLPVEVVPFGWSSHIEFLRGLGGDPVLRMRKDGQPFVTDEGNFTLDVAFPPIPGATGEAGRQGISDPVALHRVLRSRAGIVESGLFLGLTSILVVGREHGAEILRNR